MKLNKIPKSELELLPFTEIAKMYLQETKKTKNTADLFKSVCKLLELSESDYVDKIADFFESLTTSKEFILLEDGKWDLKSNHKVKVVIEDIEDEVGEESEEEKEEEPENEEQENELDMIENEDNFVDDDTDNDLSDLTIVNEEELEDE